MGEQGNPVPALPLIGVLELAKREFIAIGGCVMTDRPDLPLSAETSWTVDFSRVVSAIDDAIDQLIGADRRIGPGCERCSTHQPTLRISGRTKYVLAPQGSRKPEEGRS